MKKTMTTMESGKMVSNLKGMIIAMPLLLVIGIMKLTLVVSTMV